MPRPGRIRLTDQVIGATLQRAGRAELYDDMVGNLHVIVTEGGVASFAIRWTAGGRRRRHRLGRWPRLKIAEARKLARQRLAEVDRGGDPQADKEAARAGGRAVDDLVQEYITERSPGWRSSTVATYRSGRSGGGASAPEFASRES